MKVELLVNQQLGSDGRQLFIEGSEFIKAKKNDDEYDSFAFSTEAFFNWYGLKSFINPDEYEKILPHVSKNGAVIISVESAWQHRFDPMKVVYVVNNNKLERIEF